MQQNEKKVKQVKGFATAHAYGQNRRMPIGVRTIGKPDFLKGVKWEEQAR